MTLGLHDWGFDPKAIRHPVKEDGGEEKIEGGNNHATANKNAKVSKNNFDKSFD